METYKINSNFWLHLVLLSVLPAALVAIDPGLALLVQTALFVGVGAFTSELRNTLASARVSTRRIGIMLLILLILYVVLPALSGPLLERCETTEPCAPKRMAIAFSAIFLVFGAYLSKQGGLLTDGNERKPPGKWSSLVIVAAIGFVAFSTIMFSRFYAERLSPAMGAPRLALPDSEFWFLHGLAIVSACAFLNVWQLRTKED